MPSSSLSVLLDFASSSVKVFVTTSFLELGGAVCTVAHLLSEKSNWEQAFEGKRSLPFSVFRWDNQNFSSSIAGLQSSIMLNHSGASAIVRLRNLVFR